MEFISSFIAQFFRMIIANNLSNQFDIHRRFTPTSISTTETASSSEQVGSSENDILISTVMKIRATVQVKTQFLEWLDEQHGYGQQQGALTSGRNMSTDKKCNYQKYIECCENNAINKDGASESCVTEGCTSKRCKLMEEKIHDKKKRKEKNKKENIDETAIMDELCSPKENANELMLLDENSNLFGKDFLEVIADYTVVKPKMAGLVLNATDASNVASCSVNRFMDKSTSTAFSCEKYDVLDCSNNEDIWAPDTDSLCQTSSPSSTPSSVPSSKPSSSNSPTSSFLPTGSPTTMVSAK